MRRNKFHEPMLSRRSAAASGEFFLGRIGVVLGTLLALAVSACEQHANEEELVRERLRAVPGVDLGKLHCVDGEFCQVEVKMRNGSIALLGLRPTSFEAGGEVSIISIAGRLPQYVECDERLKTGVGSGLTNMETLGVDSNLVENPVARVVADLERIEREVSEWPDDPASALSIGTRDRSRRLHYWAWRDPAQRPGVVPWSLCDAGNLSRQTISR